MWAKYCAHTELICRTIKPNIWEMVLSEDIDAIDGTFNFELVNQAEQNIVEIAFLYLYIE